MKYCCFLMLILSTSLCFSQAKPLKVYVSKSAYFAAYSYVKNKGRFTAFKEIKGAKGKYRFEFYKKTILLKTPTGSSMLTFEKVKDIYQDRVSFSVHDKNGKRFILELYHGNVDGVSYNDIDVFELDKNNQFKALTKYVCEVL